MSLRAALRQDDHANRRAAPNLPPILLALFGEMPRNSTAFRRTSGGPSGGGPTGELASAPQEPAQGRAVRGGRIGWRGRIRRRSQWQWWIKQGVDQAVAVAAADRAAEVPGNGGRNGGGNGGGNGGWKRRWKRRGQRGRERRREWRGQRRRGALNDAFHSSPPEASQRHIEAQRRNCLLKQLTQGDADAELNAGCSNSRSGALRLVMPGRAGKAQA